MLQEPGLWVHVGAVQVVDSAQYSPDLLNHLLRECWEDPVEVQPGVYHVVPVEGGLRQCEPGCRILGRRREPGSPRELLLLGRGGPT